MRMKLRYVLPIPVLAAAALVLAKSDGQTAELKSQIKVDQTASDRSSELAGYAKVVEEVAPSVVSILVTQKAQARQADLPDMFNDPFFRRFFEEMVPEGQQPRQAPQPRRQQGQGSGVIITPSGHIMTNNHVVEDAEEIIVKLPGDKKEYTAEVIGTDSFTDLALLKIEGKNFPVATIGDSSQLKVGDTVLAIGNPFGLDQTVTSGIVSALNRDNMNIVRRQGGFAGYENFIQTDASINPGNSGGALIDHQGRVVGINTAIFSRVGGNIGIGFAIPINMAVDIVDRLQDKGTVERGYLGVLLGELSRELAQGFGLEDDNGVLVQDVVPGGPAAKAGFQAGDVIRSYRGETIEEMNKLRFMVAQTAPGTKVDFGIVRDGKKMDLNVKIGLLPEEGVAMSGGGDKEDNSADTATVSFLEGVEIVNLTPEVRARYRLEDATSGVLVTNVAADSKAADAGLQSGDLVTEVNRKKVGNVSDASEALKSTQQGVVLVRVTGEQGSRFLAIER